jgi:hypothetical protein
MVRGNDDFDVFDNTLECLVQVFGFKLEFQQSAVHLVHEQNGLDTFSDSLTQDSFGLDANTWKKKEENVRKRITKSESKFRLLLIAQLRQL